MLLHIRPQRHAHNIRTPRRFARSLLDTIGEPAESVVQLGLDVHFKAPKTAANARVGPAAAARAAGLSRLELIYQVG